METDVGGSTKTQGGALINCQTNLHYRGLHEKCTLHCDVNKTPYSNRQLEHLDSTSKLCCYNIRQKQQSAAQPGKQLNIIIFVDRLLNNAWYMDINTSIRDDCNDI